MDRSSEPIEPEDSQQSLLSDLVAGTITAVGASSRRCCAATATRPSEIGKPFGSELTPVVRNHGRIYLRNDLTPAWRSALSAVVHVCGLSMRDHGAWISGKCKTLQQTIVGRQRMNHEVQRLRGAVVIGFSKQLSGTGSVPWASADTAIALIRGRSLDSGWSEGSLACSKNSRNQE
jgi:hypothetical protein